MEADTFVYERMAIFQSDYFHKIMLKDVHGSKTQVSGFICKWHRLVKKIWIRFTTRLITNNVVFLWQILESFKARIYPVDIHSRDDVFFFIHAVWMRCEKFYQEKGLLKRSNWKRFGTSNSIREGKMDVQMRVSFTLQYKRCI